MKLKNIKKSWFYAAVIVLTVGLLSAVTWALSAKNDANQYRARGNTTEPTDIKTKLEDSGITPLTASEASNSQTTADELAYMIEEEKLAYDAYQAMYDKWGVRIFNNIKSSEATHQGLVLAVMESRGLTDPRLPEAGKFTNQALQTLYDGLIKQGDKSLADAYKVGIAIEERDIADLKSALNKLEAKDTDVKAVFENLLHGSENHLRAFKRQASR